MERYARKYAAVDAIQYTGINRGEVLKALGSDVIITESGAPVLVGDNYSMTIHEGDWVVLDEYTKRPRILSNALFNERYEKVNW